MPKRQQLQSFAEARDEKQKSVEAAREGIFLTQSCDLARYETVAWQD
jgi:hypothetical protein